MFQEIAENLGCFRSSLKCDSFNKKYEEMHCAIARAASPFTTSSILVENTIIAAIGRLTVLEHDKIQF